MKMELGAACGPELAHLPSPYLLSLYEHGRHHLWQDVARVASLGPEFALQGLRRMLESIPVSPSDVTAFILPFPGRHFAGERHRELFRQIVGENDSRVPFLVSEFGYCGGAASLVQFDRMARSGQFQPGDLVAAYVEESSKWMSGGFLVRWA
jgi:3-oxoacyl-[acyl-carrier-protein] synthase III